MSLGRLLRSAYLLYFSQPAAERALFQALRRRPIRSIVELGIGFSGRTQRLLEVAAWRADCLPLKYTGIDLFEARPAANPGLSLKAAFGAFRSDNVRVQLVPGEPHAALRRVANSLADTDLLLIAAGHDAASLEQAWTWLPRMLTDHSLIFEEQRGEKQPGAAPKQTTWQPLTLAEIQRRAQAARSGRRAA